jgi:palmitoyltransferase ZDHHC4
MSAYPYDYTIFHPPSTPTVPPCRTCDRPKPARSKHCSLCGACIAKADHHCIWLNACVGRNNYALFLLLLFSLGVLAFYGAYLAYVILNHDLQSGLVPAALTRGSGTSKRWSTGLTWTRWIDLWGWALHRQMRIGAVGLLAVLAGPLPVGLLVYHLYLIWAGMTTNESSKWADLTEDVADGLVWKAHREDVLDQEEREMEEQRVKWPIRGKWLVVVTGNGEMPGPRGRMPGLNGHLGNEGGAGRGNRHVNPIWEKVTGVAELENVYDLGFWENLRDVFLNRD